MTVSPSQSIQTKVEFTEAAQNWSLDKLYTDLASAKGKGLTPVEKLYLRALLCGYSPLEIAEQCTVSSDTVRNYLSKGLYRYIEELLVRQASSNQKVGSWNRVASLLEQVGYRLQPTPANDSEKGKRELSSIKSEALGRYWEGAPDVSVFYGRTQELETLQRWILKEGCRLVTLLGIGGIGKTLLAAKLTHQIQDQFEVVVWRSLQNAPSIESLLSDWLSLFTQQPTLDKPMAIDRQISKLITCLRQYRCLLILEDGQGILKSGELAGQYQSGCEAYGELFRRVGTEPHQSCLVLNSWEKPRGVTELEGQTQPVHSMKLKGLGEAARSILVEKNLTDEALWDHLIRSYRGNPLALKIIAATIQDLFGGSVAEFLSQNTLFLGDFTHLLYQQFRRLSNPEKVILSWLAIEGQPASLSQLRQGIDSESSWSELLQALESLGRRSLIEKVVTESETLWTLQPTVMKYVQNQA
ncbi:MAG: NB-ARC domain-containing protein [Leptolyngbyaceae cyanobacterium MO_188.B28]|nr:NB-ARC domain-containing protein [Leptolyngbyaceae cyanobacterium MO_188.B28]